MDLEKIRRNLSGIVIKPTIPLIQRTGLTPNSLTVIGLLIHAAAALLIINGYFIWAGITVLFSGLFDMLDGALAKNTNRVSKFGAMLDSVSDRMAEALVLFSICYFYSLTGQILPILLSFTTLTGSFLTSYIRARAEGLGIDCEVGWFTRAERVVLISLGLLINQIIVVLAVLTVLTFFTVVERLVHVHKQGKLGRDDNNER